MNRDRNKIERGLKDKGFRSSEGRNHKIYSYTSLSGNKTAVYTITSRGQKHRTLLSWFAIQKGRIPLRSPPFLYLPVFQRPVMLRVRLGMKPDKTCDFGGLLPIEKPRWRSV